MDRDRPSPRWRGRRVVGSEVGWKFPRSGDARSSERLTIDPRHVRIAVARGTWEPVERVELSPRQLDARGPGVLFEAGGPLGTRNRHDVVPLGEKPREGDLSGGGADLFGDCFHLGHESRFTVKSEAGNSARSLLC